MSLAAHRHETAPDLHGEAPWKAGHTNSTPACCGRNNANSGSLMWADKEEKVKYKEKGGRKKKEQH